MPTPTSAELREHCERLSDYYPTRSSERDTQDRTWRKRNWQIEQQDREEERLIQDFLDDLEIARRGQEEEPVEFAEDEYGNEVVVHELHELTCFACRKRLTSCVCLAQVSPTQLFTIRDGMSKRNDRSRSPHDARQRTDGRHRFGDAAGERRPVEDKSTQTDWDDVIRIEFQQSFDAINWTRPEWELERERRRERDRYSPSSPSPSAKRRYECSSL
jgi:hypothetical protein